MSCLAGSSVEHVLVFHNALIPWHDPNPRMCFHCVLHKFFLRIRHDISDQCIISWKMDTIFWLPLKLTWIGFCN
jgi:hypothetical protein